MKRLLSNIRVIDFSWIGAGSYTTKILADLGADVIKIESNERLDTLRVTKPFKDGVPGVNRSGYFADRNSSKRSVTLNVKSPEGLKLARQLIKDANLVVNNFTPGVMDKLGLGYESLKVNNPRLVYASMSMQGATGPESTDLGYGLTIAAVTGLQLLTGLPEKEPAGTGTNYPDHIPNPGHAAFAILAALRHQRRIGSGQNIDIAQVEPMISMMALPIMNYLVNGEIDNRNGNRHPTYAPCGVYRCVGEDRWIAISVETEAQWHALVRALQLEVDPKWDSHTARQQHHDAIDLRVNQATNPWDTDMLVAALQAAGVPAGQVNDARDVLERDPQLAARGHWVTMDHPEMGKSTYNSAPYRFSNAQSAPTSPAPLLGQHTEEVLQSLLALDTKAIDALKAQGVLS